MPTVITHNHDPEAPFLANICDLSDAEAEAVLTRIRASGRRTISSTYLRRRRETEAWLLREKDRLLGATPRARPVYGFLGDFADGLDPSRPASLVMPLEAFPAGVPTFTYPDSMASSQLGRGTQAAPYHGRVFTLAEIRTVIDKFGLPERKTQLGGISDGFVEVQVWDDMPMRSFRHQHMMTAQRR